MNSENEFGDLQQKKNSSNESKNEILCLLNNKVNPYPIRNWERKKKNEKLDDIKSKKVRRR